MVPVHFAGHPYYTSDGAREFASELRPNSDGIKNRMKEVLQNFYFQVVYRPSEEYDNAQTMARRRRRDSTYILHKTPYFEPAKSSLRASEVFCQQRFVQKKSWPQWRRKLNDEGPGLEHVTWKFWVCWTIVTKWWLNTLDSFKRIITLSKTSI